MKPPKTSHGLFERALALHRAGRTKEADALYRQVISRNAQHHHALYGLSVILFGDGRFAESSRYLERAVELQPNQPKYLTNLGEAYRRQGRLELAVAAFERVLAGDPDFPEARQNLAVTCINAGAHADALRHLERAVQVRPQDPILSVSLAWVLLRLHRPVESAARARHAIELAPTLASAHHRLADALEELGDKSGAVASYRRALELDPADHDTHSDLIVAMLTNPSFDASALFAEASAWAEQHAKPLSVHRTPHANEKDPERRLRVGYVSPDLRAHPVQQFLVPLLEHHDSASVELFLYSSVERPDLETEWYRAFAGDHFRDIRPLSDAQAAELMREDRIDVLVDLALHGPGRRLRIFALEPAPVQITWLGYAGTTGLPGIDYRITDPFVDPQGTDLRVYSETSLHLPETSWCYAPLESELEVGPLPALTTGHVTFGSQNSYRKLHPAVLRLWARVLREVSGARLFLHAEEHAREGLRQTLVLAGAQGDHVEFGGRVSRRDYLQRYQRIDIGLDPFPFNGATTTLDAAWMGVPVVTLRGDSALQRAGTCIAMNLGLPELVASSEDEFVGCAVALARELTRLSTLRAGLRSRLEASPLGDAPRFARHLEAAYRTAWRRYCAES